MSASRMVRLSSTLLLQLVAFFLGLSAFKAAATTFYVDINSTNPTPPYTNWSTASTDIQSAINQTENGDLILVNPGVYDTGGETVSGNALTNRVVINDAITVQSVTGPANTIIEGYQLPVPVILDDPNIIYPTGSSAIRCVYVSTNAALIGFTLTNGGTLPPGQSNANDENGGGVWCAFTNDIMISNCVIVANSAWSKGGGAFHGTLVDCTVLGNSAPAGGGIANSLLYGSLLISNSATEGPNPDGEGGGAFDSALFNSAIAENNAYDYGGGAYGGTLANCTVTANAARLAGGGTASCIQTNCIVYYNQILSNEPSETNSYQGNFNYCCTTPFSGGIGVITSEPVLADISHISSSSPCIGAGNPAGAIGADIDGNPWNNAPSIGCSEIPSGGDYGNLAVNIPVAFTNWAPGYPLSFQTANTGPDYMTVWNFGDGTIVTNAPYVSHAWPATGAYPVTLTAFNDSYPTGVTATVMITVAVPTNYYVNWANPNPLPPYLYPSTAATNIQDALSVAVSGSTILVTNPTVAVWEGEDDVVTNNFALYQYGGATEYPGYLYRVAITNPVTVESVNGPAMTYIEGGPEGVFMTNGATLSGFTLTNGSSLAIAIYATSTNAIITNCIINHFGKAAYSGTFFNCSLLSNPEGGCSNSTLNSCLISNNVSQYGGGDNGGIMNNCLIVSNTAQSGGGAYNCMLTNCTLIGNSATNGGGAFACIMANCTLTGNWATNSGGAAALGTLYSCIMTNNMAYNGGGSDSNTLYNCLLANNVATYGGGAFGGSLSSCVIFSNTASTEGGGCCSGIVVNCSITNNFAANGGGAFSSAVTNCLLAYNTATADGGGAEIGSLDNCLIITNVARNSGGGASWANLVSCQLFNNFAGPGTSSFGGGAYLGTLTSCVLSNNFVNGSESAYGGGAANAILTNCLIVQNSAQGRFGQGATYDCYLNNCTIVSNIFGIVGGGATNCISYYSIGVTPNYSGGTFKNCCTFPLPTGTGNITNAPLFVSLSGDFHLQSVSPCINSGNNNYVSISADLDGNPRIAGGTVDIGAYEYQSPASVISYAYLQQYGLPTDGSVDYADLDGTGFDVYQDWIAGLNPTNPASVLALQPLPPTNNASGITVSWQSVSGILYNLQRATNLSGQPPFTTIQSNIVGQAVTTSYTDTAATNNVPYFYRVGAQ